MRPPSLPTLLRTFSIANLSRQIPLLNSPSAAAFSRNLVNQRNGASSNYLYKYTASSMPTIPFIGALFSTSSKDNAADMTDYPVKKSDSEWQAVLSPEQFRVIRGKGTEAPYVGKYDKHMPKEGVYVSLSFFSSPISFSFTPRPRPPLGLRILFVSLCSHMKCRPAQPATPLSTPPTTNSSPAAAGPPTSTASRGRWSGIRIARWAWTGRRSRAPSAVGIWAMSSRGKGIRRRRMSGIASIV